MNDKDIYPGLAVWVIVYNSVWPGVAQYKNSGLYVGWFVEPEEGYGLEEIFGTNFLCDATELEPRNPNNLEEVPPLPLGETIGT